MIYNFDELTNRRKTEASKWNTYEADVTPMWVADMDFRSPEPVIQAIKERVEHGVFGYPDKEMFALREVIVDHLAERYHWQVQPEEIIFMPGVLTGFNLACHAVGTPGSGVLVHTPLYFPILSAPKNADRFRQDVELIRNSQGKYEVDWDAFKQAVTDQTRLFILCNPHNPVGRVYRRDELESMAELCLKEGIVICSDEIHCDLVYEGHNHIPIASLSPEIAQNTITLMSPSKTYNLAGLKFSFAIIQNQELRLTYQRAERGLVSSVNLMGFVAALGAYCHGQEWLEQLLVYLQTNRDFLYHYVCTELQDISMSSPEGTYLAWLDCRATNIADNPYQFFLKEAKVALNNGVLFGKGGEGFVRLNYGCPRAILGEALDRMKQAICDISRG